jgi:hypothetical protein
MLPDPGRLVFRLGVAVRRHGHGHDRDITDTNPDTSWDKPFAGPAAAAPIAPKNSSTFLSRLINIESAN